MIRFTRILTVENSNVLFLNMMLMHVESDRVVHYWSGIIPDNLKNDQEFRSNIERNTIV